MSTAGTPHFFHTFQLSDGSLVNVNIVDTAGQEQYKSINSQYYKKADGCLLVYDITKKQTFEEVKGYFYEQIQEKCKKDSNKNKYRENFKIKLATYCVYNFWIYIFIIGDYNSTYNKAILNIDIKSNDLKGLNIIAKEKQFFINELISFKIKFY